MEKEYKRSYEIANYPWGGEYRPKTTAKAELILGKGLQITLTCEETEIRAVNQVSDSPVSMIEVPNPDFHRPEFFQKLF